MIVTLQVTFILWLVSLIPPAQDAVVVEGVGMGGRSPSKMSQAHYLVNVVRLEPAKT